MQEDSHFVGHVYDERQPKSARVKCICKLMQCLSWLIGITSADNQSILSSFVALGFFARANIRNRFFSSFVEDKFNGSTGHNSAVLILWTDYLWLISCTQMIVVSQNRDHQLIEDKDKNRDGERNIITKSKKEPKTFVTNKQRVMGRCKGVGYFILR